MPEVVLHLAVSAPVATAVVRLTDVAPDGTSAQVSAGHPEPDPPAVPRRAPEPLEPGRVEEVRIALRPAGYRFAPGHRIRVSVASSAWPVVWPSPLEAEFALHRGPATPSRLVLPVVPAAGGPGDVAVPAFKTTPPDVPEVGGEGQRPTTHLADRRRRHRRRRHGHDPRRRRGRPRRRPAPVRGRDDDADRLRRRSRPREPRRRRRLPLARAATASSRSAPARIQTSDATAFHLSVDLDVDPRRRAVLRADLVGNDPAPARLTGPRT